MTAPRPMKRILPPCPLRRMAFAQAEKSGEAISWIRDRWLRVVVVNSRDR